MLEGPAVAAALRELGITHVPWIPDSELGKWEAALSADPALRLLRVAREAEAIGIAAGLLIAGQRPLVIFQCTGLFDAGDALRNVVYDLKLPLHLLVGARGQLAFERGQTGDTCPLFTEAIVQAWRLPYRVLGVDETAEVLVQELAPAIRGDQPRLLILPE